MIVFKESISITISIFFHVDLKFFHVKVAPLKITLMCKTNYVTYESHLLKHLKHIFLCLALTFSLFHQNFGYFRRFCLNAKIIHAKFVTEKYSSSRLFQPALVRTSRLFEPFFIPRGYSLTSSTKNPSVIRTFRCSNFRLFEPISEPP